MVIRCGKVSGQLQASHGNMSVRTKLSLNDASIIFFNSVDITINPSNDPTNNRIWTNEA